MLKKKICMLGAFSVGKTSLVEQYVHSVFSNKYLSTVGVKISKREVKVDGEDVSLVLWDMEGQDIYADINMAYLRGAMGFFVVGDGTRMETLEIALTIRTLAINMVGQVPSYLILNKADLVEHWEITPEMLAGLEEKGIRIIRTSAKTGMGVAEAFESLARDMLLHEVRNA